MKKIQLDEQSFINIFNSDDFKNGEVLQGIINSCEKIIKSYKDITDTTSEVDDFKDKTTTFFLNETKLIASVLYSKKDCEPGKRKPICFTYFSSKDKDCKNWDLEMSKIRQGFGYSDQKTLFNFTFKYLKENDAEKISVNAETVEKDKLFEELINETSIEKEIIENLSNLNLSSDICENSAKSTNFAQYYLNLKTFKPFSIKNQELSA